MIIYLTRLINHKTDQFPNYGFVLIKMQPEKEIRIQLRLVLNLLFLQLGKSRPNYAEKYPVAFLLPMGVQLVLLFTRGVTCGEDKITKMSTQGQSYQLKMITGVNEVMYQTLSNFSDHLLIKKRCEVNNGNNINVTTGAWLSVTYRTVPLTVVNCQQSLPEHFFMYVLQYVSRIKSDDRNVCKFMQPIIPSADTIFSLLRTLH